MRTQTKYTVTYYDDALDYHIERIESFRPLDEIEETYYSDYDIETITEGW